MKLNLDKNMLTLKGEPTNEKLSDILANILAMSTVGKPAQMITWAVNLTNTGEIDISKEDAKFIMDIVINSPNYVNLAKAQVIEEIEKLLE
ncbi:hypothetical protein EV204_105162 [Tissierella praeacuta]|nr:hypothetical protein [Tissierella praeacuta]TCU72826.1 hypothetical protein EV204_105162 [Tissierella praeacuta]